jgi:hypothetical protein
MAGSYRRALCDNLAGMLNIAVEKPTSGDLSRSGSAPTGIGHEKGEIKAYIFVRSPNAASLLRSLPRAQQQTP